MKECSQCQGASSLLGLTTQHDAMRLTGPVPPACTILTWQVCVWLPAGTMNSFLLPEVVYGQLPATAWKSVALDSVHHTLSPPVRAGVDNLKLMLTTLPTFRGEEKVMPVTDGGPLNWPVTVPQAGGHPNVVTASSHSTNFSVGALCRVG